MVRRLKPSLWDIREREGPLVATAIHDGHGVSPLNSGLMAVSEADRLREEDPHTGTWARLADTYVVATRSRFEVDLNRPRNKAVYIAPEDSWGIKVWKETPSIDVVEQSLRQYDAFYAQMESLLAGRVERYPHVVVLDFHTYNHRRSGPGEAPADPETNPEVNIGTGTMNRKKWASWQANGRPGECQIQRRPFRGMDPREVSGICLCHRHRVQKNLHGRMDRSCGS